MVQKSCIHQLKLVIHPIICRVLPPSQAVGLQPSEGRITHVTSSHTTGQIIAAENATWAAKRKLWKGITWITLVSRLVNYCSMGGCHWRAVVCWEERGVNYCNLARYSLMGRKRRELFWIFHLKHKPRIKRLQRNPKGQSPVAYMKEIQKQVFLV